MKKRKLSFKELIMENKLELIRDAKAIEKIEIKIDNKHSKRLQLS
jgi:hypothetical protein